MKSPVVQTKDLIRRFGNLVAVDQISLEIDAGELFGLLGPNGAGKTTLLKLLTGQLAPNSGACNVLGVDPVTNPIEVKKKIGIVPEAESPPSFLTPKEYLEYIGLIREMDNIEEEAGHWMDYLDLSEFQNVPGKDLSKGTRQKVMLAAAFIHKPRLVFLDEPFIGLDPYHQKLLKEHLMGYLGNGGTIFMCTHILEIAEKVCSKIAIINRGKIIACGTLSELVNENEGLDLAFLRLTGRASAQ